MSDSLRNWIWMLAVWPTAALAEPCREVSTRINALAPKASPAALRSLGPSFGPAALPALRARFDADPDVAIAAGTAFGLARHAEGLRQLTADPSPGLAEALALLALGDGVRTGSIAAELYEGSVQSRRRIARALSVLKQKRPRLLLYQSLVDTDSEVRWLAARALLDQGLYRPQRVLTELLREDDLARVRAARALLGAGRRLPAEVIPKLPPQVAVRAWVRAKENSWTSNEVQRTAALAVLLLQDPKQEVFDRAALRYEKLYPSVAPEFDLGRALRGDTEAVARLGRLDGAQAAKVVLLWWALGSAARGPFNQSEIRSVASTLESWIMRRLVAPADESRILSAAAGLDEVVGAELARARLLGPDGAGLRTAARVLAHAGELRDVARLLDAANRSAPRTQAVVLTAAARLCRVQPGTIIEAGEDDRTPLEVEDDAPEPEAP